MTRHRNGALGMRALGEFGYDELQDFTEELKMRRWFLAALLLGCMTASGCAIPIYSALPERRAEQLIYTSENLRLLIQEWERFWFLDQPDHMTPYRVHGGVI